MERAGRTLLFNTAVWVAIMLGTMLLGVLFGNWMDGESRPAPE